MAELLQLDKAAALIGKSEVTLRRLIKAGKIPFQKEKTLTGFIYLVDPKKVEAYYKLRSGGVFTDTSATKTDPFKELVKKAVPEAEAESVSNHQEPEMVSATPQAVRVAVAEDSRPAYEYWQKKSDLYEDKYNQEVLKHAQAREELGMWRGRAEQAQTMLLKLLPPAEGGEANGSSFSKSASMAKSREEVSLGSVFLIAGLVVVLVVIIAAGAFFYLKFAPK